MTHPLSGRLQRVHLAGGATREVAITIDPRSLSSVDDKGSRAILPGKYTLSIGGAQPRTLAPNPKPISLSSVRWTCRNDLLPRDFVLGQ